MSYCADKLMIDGQTHTHAGNDNTWRPKLASGKNEENRCSRVSCQKGPTRHAYAWQIGPFWQDKLDLCHHQSSIGGAATYQHGLLMWSLSMKLQYLSVKQLGTSQWRLPGHQQLGYWPIYLRTFQLLTLRGLEIAAWKQRTSPHWTIVSRHFYIFCQCILRTKMYSHIINRINLVVREPLKFHTKYHTHTLKYINFIWMLKFKSSEI